MDDPLLQDPFFISSAKSITTPTMNITVIFISIKITKDNIL